MRLAHVHPDQLAALARPHRVLGPTPDGRVAVDLDAGPGASAVAPAAPRGRPPSSWDDLFAGAPRVDLADVGRWLDDCQRRLGDNRGRQLAALRAERPCPTGRFATHAGVCRWALWACNSVRVRLGKPSLTWAGVGPRWGWPSPVILPDRVVCLSLASRDDRWEAFTASCRTSRLLSEWGPVERYVARLPDRFIVPDYWPKVWNASHYATKRDHLDIWEQSHVAGYRAILVFEDDAIVTPEFDVAYTAACHAMPPGWMWLNLTSDGHQRPSVPVGPGLERVTGQLFLHALLLSRAGMRRAFSHVTFNPNSIIDGATSNLHAIEPHFYAVTKNAVVQIGQRDLDGGRRVDYFGRHG